jgi:hypothetical protein
MNMQPQPGIRESRTILSGIKETTPALGLVAPGPSEGNGAGTADRRGIRRDASTLRFQTLCNFDHFAEIKSK